MDNQDKQILNEVLLELTLAIGNESNHKRLLKNCLPLILRRLNCIAAGVFNIENNIVYPSYFIPYSFPENKEFKFIIEKLEAKAKGSDDCSYFEIKEEKNYTIFFGKRSGTVIMLKRRLEFDQVQINDLMPIMNFLNVALGNAVEREKRLKLQATLKRLSLVASQSTNGVIITNKQGEIEWVNDGFTRLTGYELNEVIGNKPGMLLQGPKSDPKLIQYMREQLQKEQPFEVEIINYTKDKQEYWIQITCNPMYHENGELQGFMAMESDISERKIAESKIIQAKQDAEFAKEAEKQFLANMSHEIRTPLNAVIGMTSLLLDTDTSPEQLDYLNTLNTSANFLLKLISNVLDISKIQAGKIDARIETVDLYQCLQTVHKTFLNKASNSNVAVELKIKANVPDVIKTDEVLLTQILNNLMSNAEKFTEAGEIGLIVSAENLKSKKPQLLFEIYDSGEGISEDRLEYIFRKFTQVKDKNKKDKRGTGLGLAITKELVELLGGDISVKSKLGVGTTFNFQIPIELVDSKPAVRSGDNIKPPLSYAEVNFEKCNILIVEDNPINQKYIKKIFERNKIPYDLADNGIEAVAKCRLKKYDLILMDIQMPVMDGLEASKSIRNNVNLNQDTCIIALTASALREDKHNAFDAGMNGFLTKPFTPTILIESLKQHLFQGS